MVRPGFLGRKSGSDRTSQCWPRPRSAASAIWDPAVSSAAGRRPPITVALVDDEQLIRVGLAEALSGSELELVGEAATGEDGIELVVDVRPDVVLMDLQ